MNPDLKLFGIETLIAGFPLIFVQCTSRTPRLCWSRWIRSRARTRTTCSASPCSTSLFFSRPRLSWSIAAAAQCSAVYCRDPSKPPTPPDGGSHALRFAAVLLCVLRLPVPQRLRTKSSALPTAILYAVLCFVLRGFAHCGLIMCHRVQTKDRVILLQLSGPLLSFVLHCFPASLGFSVSCLSRPGAWRAQVQREPPLHAYAHVSLYNRFVALC